MRLPLSDLSLFLNDLFDKRHAALVASNTGKSYEPILAKRRTAISALPAALIGGKPLAVELNETDDVHDGTGSAVWLMTESYRRYPGTSPHLLAALKRIRATFIPSLSELNESYATEAEAAMKRKTLLAAHKADLALFPVADGKSLYDWTVEFLNAGEKLNTLLSQRADAGESGRRNASKLRSEVIGVVNRFRASLRDELDDDPSLPRDLEAQVFAYLDELHAMRLAAADNKK